MADEPSNYDRIVDALKKVYAEQTAENIKLVTQSTGGYFNPEPTMYERDAQAARLALGSPGLILGLCKHLFGETEEE